MKTNYNKSYFSNDNPNQVTLTELFWFDYDCVSDIGTRSNAIKLHLQLTSGDLKVLRTEI